MNIVLSYLYNNANKHVREIGLTDRPIPEYKDISVIHDLTYAEHGGEKLALDIYRPVKYEGQMLPIAVFIHGGGFFVGDKKFNADFCAGLARYGFMVASPDYRLINRTDGAGIISDVCAVLDYLSRNAGQYGGDRGNVVLIGESAGAFAGMYATAMSRSRSLCTHLGCKQPELRVTSAVFTSGMFYANKADPIGLIYRKELYGKKRKDKRFMKAADPDSPTIVGNLPPVFLTTSKGDYLRYQTISFAKALSKAGHPFRLINCKDRKDLGHAFVSRFPELKESKIILKKIVKWLKAQ